MAICVLLAPNVSSQEKQRFGVFRNENLVLSRNGAETTVFLGNQILFSKSGNLKLYSHKVVFSQDGLTAACIVYVQNPQNFQDVSLRYAGLQISRKLNGVWKMDSGIILDRLPEKYKWISEIGAISNNGKFILAQFGIVVPIDKEERVIGEWETWSADGQFLKRGLFIDNDGIQASGNHAAATGLLPVKEK